MRPLARRSAVLAAGGVCAAALAGLATAEPPAPRWRRANYRQRSVTLAGGPALALGAACGAVVSGQPAAAAITLTAATLGLYDDLYGDTHARGLAGHARALRGGRLTTGLVKMAGLAALGAVAARRLHHRGVDAALDLVLVAGSANLVNLLDLRPGRALKVVVPGAVAAAVGGDAVAGALGAAAAVALPGDLAEMTMLGDCGANAAGATLGWCVASGAGDLGRVLTAVAVVGLTVASERVSFSAVIDDTPWLRALDRLGRQT